MKVWLVVFLFISALSHAGRISAGTWGDADYYWVIICVISLITLFVWWMKEIDDDWRDY